MTNTFYERGEQRSAKVNALFRRIARRYDLVNDVQSIGLHRRWKKRVVRLTRINTGQSAIDVCCGTGDITFALAASGAKVVGLDFTPEMLTLAGIRGRKSVDLAARPTAGLAGSACFMQADAESIPFLDNSFDAVSVGYGLRNLPDWRRGIQEMKRVAKPGGRLVILEFGKPQNAAWRFLYLSYLKLFVPLLGLIFHGNISAYSYILESLKHYPSQIEVADGLRNMGLVNVKVHNLLGGAMSVHYAEKSANSCQV